MKPINYLDGFSGYGGFHLALKNAGYEFNKCYYSEIDKYAIANYKYNFPESIYAGSITDIPTNGIIEGLDLFTFGWPCQDNSIAGKRKGQSDGTRSGLLHKAVDVISKYTPRCFVAENVTGLLSVNEGVDIVESFKLLSFLNNSCPQYDIEMQLFNSCWLLPQNRERLLFVGYFREGRSTNKRILPINERDLSVDEVKISQRPRTNIAPALTISMPESARRNIASSYSFRDLTNIEYERLQGLPDNWTRFGVINGDKIELSKGRRYKLCGNGVSEPIVRMIVEKLKQNYE